MESYHRKLRPSGARFVRRRIGVGDWLGVIGGWEGDDGGSGKEKSGEV